MSILKYNLKGVPVTKRTLIHRALYGYIDHSNKGTYTYNRKGALEQINHTKIGNGTLMLSQKDIKILVPLFNKYNIKINIINVMIP